GRPKGVERTHGALLAQHRVLAREFPLLEDDVELTTFPVFALHNLAAGVTSIIPHLDLRRIDRVDAGAVLRDAREHGVTTLTASPPLFDQLAAHRLARGGQSWGPRRLLTGGAVVTDSQLRTWRRAFPAAEIRIAYGSSEAEPVAHISAEERLALGNRPGCCVGRPVDAVDVRLRPLGSGVLDIGDDGDDGVGELCVRGDHVCCSQGDGWHPMGDTGSFDDGGRFWLAGRVHSTIIRGGRAVHAQLLEHAAGPGDHRLRRLAAVGVPDAELGERVAVVLECAPADAAAVRARVAERLGAADLPCDQIHTTDRPLPLDPRHRSKIDYGQLRRRIEGVKRSAER
ncbi:MAG: AMP-binding protein, partial [Acidobacteriota bacterium]